jgi:hypothetical protein
MTLMSYVREQINDHKTNEILLNAAFREGVGKRVILLVCKNYTK